MIDKPTFRNPDKFQILPFREWIRGNLPCGRDGYVVEDLDLVLRVFGKRYMTDGIGRFMFVELKFGDSFIGVAQKKTFGLIHGLLRVADPKGERYLGYFVVQYDNEDWELANFKINHQEITQEDFFKFLSFERPITVDVDDFPYGWQMSKRVAGE